VSGTPPSNALLRSALGAVRYRLTGHRMPLAVTAVITHRCDALCRDCSVPLVRRPELDTRAWVKILDELARLGCVRVGFTGGEPLVREDLPVLIDRCHTLGMWTTLETNGYRYPERAGELTRLGRIMISLEGRADVHDQVREPGGWRQAMDAIEAAADRNVDRCVVMTLSRENLDQVDWVLETAERTGSKAVFQLLQSGTCNAPRSAAGHLPTADETRRTLRRLLEYRLAGRPVDVSEKLLRYLLTWEDYRVSTSRAPHEDVHCMAGQLHAAIDADGTVLPCVLRGGCGAAGRAPDVGFAAAFESLRDNSCRACSATPLAEYNFLFNLDGAALYERARALLTPGGRAA